MVPAMFAKTLGYLNFTTWPNPDSLFDAMDIIHESLKITITENGR
jgi:hypothetical protein